MHNGLLLHMPAEDVRNENPCLMNINAFVSVSVCEQAEQSASGGDCVGVGVQFPYPGDAEGQSQAEWLVENLEVFLCVIPKAQ